MSLTLPLCGSAAAIFQPWSRRFLGPGWKIEPAAMQVLGKIPVARQHRQLNNAINAHKILANEGMVTVHDLPREVGDFVDEP